MNKDATLFKLSRIFGGKFGKTEITLLLSENEIGTLKKEVDEALKDCESFSAYMEPDNSIASQLGMQRFMIDEIAINLCDREKFLEMFLKSTE